MKNKRRRFLVDGKVQYALGARVAFHWGVFLIATIVLTTSLRMVGSIDSNSLWEVFLMALREQSVSLVVILALLPWFLHDALVLSNRFAGPMVRLRSAIRELAREEQVHETHTLSFRNGDFWPEIADEFNLLQERVHSSRLEVEALRAQLQSVGAEAAQADPSSLIMQS